ncbi:MAG: hypothetical protein TRG1_3589 [Flavobacteriaceae bacterium FS1-H7996/R]|nr:MAG: hypothetical protein TRG1_3589 [Flavobacteriaceae bacterium FS1-H7996/R]
MSFPFTVATTFWGPDENALPLLNKSANTKANNANAMTMIKNSERCLILFKTAI